jgi:hypothetical protein
MTGSNDAKLGPYGINKINQGAVLIIHLVNLTLAMASWIIDELA